MHPLHPLLYRFADVPVQLEASIPVKLSTIVLSP
jgi:hypothetical protein